MAISIIDIESQIVPNRILYPAVLLAAPAARHHGGRRPQVGVALARGRCVQRSASSASSASISSYPKGMGFGDVRLAGLVGGAAGWMGFRAAFVAFFLMLPARVGRRASCSSSITGKGRRTTIGFAPYMAAGTLIVVIFTIPDLPAAPSVALPQRLVTAPIEGASAYAPVDLVPVLRYLTAGESHGRALVVIIEGFPPGLGVTVEEVQGELARRRLGYGRGPRMRFEADEVTLIGGIRHGRTLGSPVAIEIANTEWPKWEEEMSPHPGAPEQDPHRAAARSRRSGRDAEVRVRRRPRRARAGICT